MKPNVDTRGRVMIPDDKRRAESRRMNRKLALTLAVQVSTPGADAADVVGTARLFAGFLLNEETDG